MHARGLRIAEIGVEIEDRFGDDPTICRSMRSTVGRRAVTELIG
jgi:hypothetical protein